MKRHLLLLLFCWLVADVWCQMITSGTPARLQVYALQPDGNKVMMTSEQFTVLYNDLIMNGELELNSFRTEDEILENLLDSAWADRITITGKIPEGRFMFHDMLEEEFPIETDVTYGEYKGRIILNYTVSNRKTSLANTFEITVTGSISLRDDLGILRDTGLDDRISFMFFQTVVTKSY